MTADERFDEMVSGWLVADAPEHLPRRVLDAAFERTRGSRQYRGWLGVLGRQERLSAFASLAGAAVVFTVLGFALAIGWFGGAPIVGGPATTPDPRSVFLGTWISTSDSDGGTQVMTIRTANDGAVEIVVTDDVASVCSRTPSTMTGGGHVERGTKLVIPAPVYTCDDGSDPTAASGPPLAEQLRNLTFTRDAQTDRLVDNFRDVWVRSGGAAYRT